MEIPGFKSWLQLLDDKTHVRCTVCEKNLKSSFGGLKKHAQSYGHYSKEKKECPPPDHNFKANQQMTLKQKSIIILELQFIAMALLAKIPFANIPLVLSCLQNMLLNSLLKFMKIGATKAHNVCVHVFAKFEKAHIIKILQNHCFNICIDEGTDVSKDAALTIVARYTDPNDHLIKTLQWDTVKIYKEGKKAAGGSKVLFDIIKTSFEKYNVSLKNIMGNQKFITYCNKLFYL